MKRIEQATQALKDGADPNARMLLEGVWGDFHPLMLALMRWGDIPEEPEQRLALLQTLLDHGSDPRMASEPIVVDDRDGKPIVVCGNMIAGAAFGGSEPAELEALLQAGLPTFVNNDPRDTLLHELAKHRGPDVPQIKTQMVQALVQHGLDLEALDGQSKTPLEHALEQMNHTNVQALLSATPGARLGWDDRTGRWVFMALGNDLSLDKGGLFLQTVQVMLPHLAAFWETHPEQRDGLTAALNAFCAELGTRAVMDGTGGRETTEEVGDAWWVATTALSAQGLQWHLQPDVPEPEARRRLRP